MTTEATTQLVAVEVDTREVSALMDRLNALATAAADAVDGEGRRLTEKDGETLAAATDLAMKILEAGEPETTHALTDLTVVRFARLDHEFSRPVDVEQLLDAAESLAYRVERCRPSADAGREIMAANRAAADAKERVERLTRRLASAAAEIERIAAEVGAQRVNAAQRQTARHRLADVVANLRRPV